MPALTPEQRALHARLAAHEKWAQTDDPTAATAPARKAFLDRFERQVDPDGSLPPVERARRAEHAEEGVLPSARAEIRRRQGRAKGNVSTPTVRVLMRAQVEAAGLRVGTHPENRAALRLHRWGLTFEQQYPIGPYRLDLAFVDVRVAVEVDGWHHQSPDGAAKDARRDAFLRTRGWIVLRVNDGDGLEDQLCRVAEVVNGLTRG